MIKYCFQDEVLVFLDLAFRPEVKHGLDVFI